MATANHGSKAFSGTGSAPSNIPPTLPKTSISQLSSIFLVVRMCSGIDFPSAFYTQGFKARAPKQSKLPKGYLNIPSGKRTSE